MSRSADANTAMARTLSAGVESFTYSGQAVASMVNAMAPAYQTRIADFVFHMIRVWGRMAEASGANPDHPLHEVHRKAAAMQRGI